MAQLPDLPPEIISMILRWVLPEDLENFTQSCRAVQQEATRVPPNRAWSLLEQHWRLIRRHSVISSLEGAEPLLRPTAHDPRVVRYVRTIELREAQHHASLFHWPDDNTWHKEAYENLVSAARNVHLESQMANSNTNSSRYLSDTIRSVCANTDLAIALFFALLPNLTVLTFQWDETQCLWTKELLANIDTANVTILTKLREVYLVGPSRSYGCSLKELASLSAIPSLRTLSALKPRPFRCEKESQAGRPFQKSGVKDLKLWGCSIDTGVLLEYLQAFNKLEEFKFGHSPTSEDRTFDFRPILTTLLRQAKWTLKRLALLSYRGDTPARISLGDFPNLRSVYLDWKMLFPLPNIAGQNLSSRLPSSLENITIHDHNIPLNIRTDHTSNIIKTRYSPVVEDVVSSKTNGLPLTQSFSFTALCGLHYTLDEPWVKGMEDVEKAFQKLCKRAGIDFEFERFEPY